MWKKLILVCAIFTVFLYGCTNTNNIVEEDIHQEMNTRNEASVYCEENWWVIEIVPDEWWERWKCNFADGSFCEERSFFHGECSPSRWEWTQIEIDGDEKDYIDEKNGCPAEKNLCDDWTFVIREGTNCEFWTCPWYKIDDAEDVINWIIENNEIDTWSSNLTENDIKIMEDVIDAFVDM